MYAPPVEPGQLGFRCPVTARSGDTAGKLATSPAAGGKCRLERARILILDDGLGAVAESIVATWPSAHAEIHPGAHRGFVRVLAVSGCAARNRSTRTAVPTAARASCSDVGAPGGDIALHPAVFSLA